MRFEKTLGKGRQQGLYLVEFAIVAGVFFFIMFALLEVARMMFVWSALDSMTQRGARVAAVCPLNDPAVADVAIYDGSMVPGITAANIGVRYLTEAGAPATTRGATRLVEVSIQNYTHQMLIPATLSGFVAPLLTAPSFTTTRPAESLGRNPDGPDFC